MHVGFQRYADPNTRRFLTAREQAGIAEIGDIHLASGQAVGLTQVDMPRGRRWSVYDGYLRRALRRANLELRTGCTAHRVILEGSRCTGVEYAVATLLHEIPSGRNLPYGHGRPRAVVGPSLLVHGVAGLRVEDDSADACPVKGTGRGR